jgi:hypothetical protein
LKTWKVEEILDLAEWGVRASVSHASVKSQQS